MRFSRGKKQLLALTATVAVLSSVAWQVQPAITHWQRQQQASRIAQGIENGSPDTASEHFQRLADLGTPALNSLVDLASSQRTRIARQARRIVDEKFATWQIQAEVDSTFDLALPTTTLASALARHADRFDSLGNRWATSLAIRMIDLTESLSTNDATKLLVESNLVLAAIAPQGPRLRTFPQTALQKTPAEENRLNIPDVRLDLLAVPSESVREIEQRTSLPEEKTHAGDTPKNHAAHIPEPATPLETSASKSSQWSPEWIGEPSTQNLLLAPIGIPTLPPLPRVSQPHELTSEVVDIPTPLEMEQHQKTLRKVSSKILITQLPKANHYDAGSIRVVLRQRGFTESEWALAEMFSSPQAKDRNQLVEAVSFLPAGNTRRWLHWLLKDEAAEVRLHALTALATTNDPQLFRLAREMAIADQDVRVSELASRIMRQVR